MATYRVLYWHSIPAQVRAEDENGRAGVQLPERFQLAIDEAAVAANLIGEDEYLEGFRWSDSQERHGSAQQVAEAVARELDQEYEVINWKKVVAGIKKGGSAPLDPSQ